MSENISLKNAEQKMLKMSFQDGLVELYLGIYFILMAVSNLFRESWGVGMSYLPVIGFLVLGTIGLVAGQKYFVVPRLGLVSFSPKRKMQQKTLKGVVIAIVVLTFGVFLMAANGSLKSFMQDAPWWTLDAVFGVLVFAVFSGIAYVRYAPRFYLYGVVLGLSMPMNEILRAQVDTELQIGSVIAGIFLLVMGAVLFMRFVKKYPLPAEAS